MTLDILLCIGGLVGLIGGGEVLVRGATALALRLHVSPAVVGLTIVAAGTSMPELVVSVLAALADAPELAVGNVVGSNIYNILLILGIAALVRPLTTTWATVRLEWPVMALAAWMMHLLSRDGTLDRVEGAFLLAGLVVFVAWTVRIATRDAGVDEQEQLAEPAQDRGPTGSWWLVIGSIVVGVALLAGGAQLLVTGATSIATDLGVPERIIGLTLVAVGTSLPELVTSVIAAARGNSAIAIGNVVGSNIFNVLGILGATAIIVPVPVGASTLALDNWVMLGASVLLFPMLWTALRIDRWEGAVLLAGAAGWTAVLFTWTA